MLNISPVVLTCIPGPEYCLLMEEHSILDSGLKFNNYHKPTYRNQFIRVMNNINEKP